MRVKPSIIFATWFDREIGLMSFSTDLGGICLGRGDTIACFREGGSLSTLIFFYEIKSSLYVVSSRR